MTPNKSNQIQTPLNLHELIPNQSIQLTQDDPNKYPQAVPTDISQSPTQRKENIKKLSFSKRKKVLKSYESRNGNTPDLSNELLTNKENNQNQKIIDPMKSFESTLKHSSFDKNNQNNIVQISKKHRSNISKSEKESILNWYFGDLVNSRLKPQVTQYVYPQSSPNLMNNPFYVSPKRLEVLTNNASKPVPSSANLHDNLLSKKKNKHERIRTLSAKRIKPKNPDNNSENAIDSPKVEPTNEKSYIKEYGAGLVDMKNENFVNNDIGQAHYSNPAAQSEKSIFSFSKVNSSATSNSMPPRFISNENIENKNRDIQYDKNNLQQNKKYQSPFRADLIKPNPNFLQNRPLDFSPNNYALNSNKYKQFKGSIPLYSLPYSNFDRSIQTTKNKPLNTSSASLSRDHSVFYNNKQPNASEIKSPTLNSINKFDKTFKYDSSKNRRVAQNDKTVSNNLGYPAGPIKNPIQYIPKYFDSEVNYTAFSVPSWSLINNTTKSNGITQISSYKSNYQTYNSQNELKTTLNVSNDIQPILNYSSLPIQIKSLPNLQSNNYSPYITSKKPSKMNENGITNTTKPIESSNLNNYVPNSIKNNNSNAQPLALKQFNYQVNQPHTQTHQISRPQTIQIPSVSNPSLINNVSAD